ncbi:DUF885 domain-containing protein [Hymenobacter sp. BRD67]|uniref:DUF885 domain-containing protein n=1 Tax=Hymenobacter sp. BRD67 TaxID=2675877 RepID=UPI001564C717|nr:DUF885 domain-containing protein [Hymenobacter sp. BRD67]QKG51659.1 DUF885 domain-containing protein [Hymenobacter sp. BRD67]
MKHFLLASCLVAGLAAPALAQPTRSKATAPGTQTSAPLAALFTNYWEEQAKLYPLQATSQGDNRFNDQLPNSGTRAFRLSQQRLYERYRDQLARIDRSRLSAADQTSYDVFQYEMTTRLKGLAQPTWTMPFTQFSGLPIELAQLGAGTGSQPFKTVKDYDNWLSRVRQFTVWGDTAIADFRQGMRSGVVLPKVLVQKMIPQLEALAVADPEQSVFYGPVKQMPATFSAADKQRFTTAYAAAIRGELVPTYRKLAAFLRDEYLPAARTSTGIAAVPGGADMYTYAVSYWTTTTRTPEEIYQTGLSEVVRIKAEMEQVRQQLGFQGDLKALFAYVNTDPKFHPYQTPEDVLNGFRSILARVEPGLPRLFGRTPKTAFEIRQTEAFRAASASAAYTRGSADGSRPGIFYVPILDATKFKTPGMESLFLHEAIPGHHYQVSLQQENTALPKFQRFAFYSAFSEGWALYTESLGKELGMYTDPYQYLGALSAEMHRAIRLVVDVGMHAKGLTREQAIQYMLDNEATTEQGATAEIERYMAWPGQALAYKTGQLKIRELRTRYEKQLGAKFSLKAFHDELLLDGAMPLAVLERRMDAWASRQK